MGISTSLGLIAIGAIMEFAMPHHLGPFQVGTIGIILMVVGAIGLVASMVIWGPRDVRPLEPEGEVVEERRLVGRRRPW